MTDVEVEQRPGLITAEGCMCALCELAAELRVAKMENEKLKNMLRRIRGQTDHQSGRMFCADCKMFVYGPEAQCYLTCELAQVLYG